MIPAAMYMRFAFDFEHRNKYPNLRFGQAFWNIFSSDLDAESDTEVFYEEDTRKAKGLIERKYIAYSSNPY